MTDQDQDRPLSSEELADHARAAGVPQDRIVSSQAFEEQDEPPRPHGDHFSPGLIQPPG